jgi:hypothetical protein
MVKGLGVWLLSASLSCQMASCEGPEELADFFAEGTLFAGEFPMIRLTGDFAEEVLLNRCSDLQVKHITRDGIAPSIKMTM